MQTEDLFSRIFSWENLEAAFRRKFKQMLRVTREGRIGLAALDASVQGWVNHARYGDTWGLRRSILSARLPKMA